MSARGVDIPVVFKSDTKGLKDADDALGRIGGGLKNFGIAAGVAFAAAAAGAVAFGANALKAAADADHITKNMSNAAMNAGLFGDTAGEISKVTEALDKHSTKLAEMTGVDDEYINGLKTSWLSVPAIAGMGIDGINRLATISLDLAASAGKDSEQVATVIAKAFENPESAIKKLQKAGVYLTDQQNEMYDSLVASGQAAEAQGYLIDTLEQKYKGAAEAAANPFARLKVILENLQETIGSAMLPAIEKLVPIIATFVDELTASPEFQAFIDGLAIAFGQLVDAVLPLLPPLMEMITTLMPTIIELITLLAPVVLDLFKAFEPLLPIFIQLVETLLPPLVELVGNFIKMIVDNPNFLGDVNKNFETMAAIIEPIRWTLQTIADLLGQIGGKAKIIDGLEARARATQTLSLIHI